MRRFRILTGLVLVAFCLFSCNKPGGDPSGGKTPDIEKGEHLADVTYQVNVYSFADSDGNGWGDLKGVAQHLDYFESLGVSALWLSPVQDAMSYHGYNVKDYSAINPKLGTEADFKDLISKAKAKGNGIYMDYVLNHSGSENAWFQGACSDPSSPYRDYYVLSENPSADVAAGKIDNYGGSKTPGMGQWYPASGGNLGYNGFLHFKLDVSNASQPKLTVTQSSGPAQGSNSDSSVKWFIYENNPFRMYKTGGNVYEITLFVNNTWGVLVKDDPDEWGNHKWGAKSGDQTVEFGKAKTLVKGDAANDFTFGGTNLQYFASFDRSMPDLNYGPYATASESAAFKDLAASADKWIKMGVAGLRLDAVIWIYQNQTAANVAFLKQWYDRCNATWKANGGQGDFYMVGEAWCENAEQMAPYYKGLPSNFNFYYWYTLKDRIKKARGDDFAKTVLYFRGLFKAQRPGFIDAIKLTNHDEDRAAEDLGKSLEKEKLAAAVLLTSPGKPYIYQGEELGYWGNKGGGDEYVRAPIKWTKTGTVPTAALGGKVDNTMLSANISVEAQSADEASLLSVYRKFSQARNTYKALARGEISEVSSSNPAIALWTMSYEGQTVLVAHNFGAGVVSVNVPGGGLSAEGILVSNGVVTANDTSLTLGAYASAVFAQ